jgi:FMN reductase
MRHQPIIVGIGGTTRPGSTTERALNAALAEAEKLGARAIAIAGPELPQEPYDPASRTRSPQARHIVESLAKADGVILASPSYHGSLSGLIKNALDYVEDLRGDARPYLEGRAVGCIVAAEGPQAMGTTLSALRAIVHALRGWPTPYGVLIDAKSRPFGEDGEAPANSVAESLRMVAGQVVEFARMRRLLYDETHSRTTSAGR